MSKITDYLRQHLTGEVTDDFATREYFSTDGGIFANASLMAIYPRTTNDVRKAARFSWRLAERGTILPLTARGFGENQNSAAIGNAGVILPAHMSRILEIDPKLKLIRVQPGISTRALNEAAATHGLKFFASDYDDFATVGGILGENSFSRKTAKCGPVIDWTERLEVVLANGEVIQTGRLSRKELSEKKGLQTMEGEIYRALDAIIDENEEKIANLGTNLPFAIDQVKLDDGSFDLTPLFVGSEGTLGIITQAILKLEQVPENSLFVVAALNGQNLSELAAQIATLEPSEISFIDGETLELTEKKLGDTSWQRLAKNRPSALLFVEFDDKKSAKKAKKLAKIFEDAEVEDANFATEFEEQEGLRSLRAGAREFANFNEKGIVAPPIGNSLIVQSSRIPEFVAGAKTLLAKHHLEGGIWGEISSGILTVQPLLNPTNLGQKQSMFKLISELRELADKFSSPEENQIVSGRLGSMFIGEIYDKDALKIFADVKTTFDPFGILNPGVKFGLTADELSRKLKENFAAARFREM